MTTFKTRSEIAAAGEFIQALEPLRSGSLASGQGTNRALERLAENDNALLEAVQQAKSSVLAGGGNVALSGGSLSWSADMTVYFAGEVGAVTYNTITAATISIASGNVLYVLLDRSVQGAAVSVSVATDFSAYLAVITGASSRLDYQVIALYDGSVLHFTSGSRLLSGESLSGGLVTDSQYGQQSEVTAVRGYQRENKNIRMIGGGDISWDSATNTLTWSQTIYLTFPSAGGTNRIIGPSSVVVSPDSVWFATLARSPAGVSTLSTGVGALSGGVPADDNSLALAIHNSVDGRIYLMDGTALSDSETVKLGGVRIGVQWFYSAVGSGAQVIDIDASVAGPTSYRVGSGELMVYRNGMKATPSKAYWAGGAYPVGALNTSAGALSTRDSYVEEDIGDGTGTRIIWLSDGQIAGEPLFHSLTAHSPGTPYTWPDSTDYVEAFIGVQGAAPSVNLPDGIYGFERVWTSQPTTVSMGGGKLISNSEVYVSPLAGISLTVSSMIGGEVLAPDSWHYAYIGPGVSVGAAPAFALSTQPPAVLTAGHGVHPTSSGYRFVASVYVRATSDILPMSKAGSQVALGRHFDVSAPFSSAVADVWSTVDLSAHIPAGVSYVRLRLLITAQAAVAAGSRLLLEAKVPGFAAPGQESYAIKPSNSNIVEFLLDMPLDALQSVDIRLSSASFQNVAAVYLIGYSEGTYSSGQGLL